MANTYRDPDISRIDSYLKRKSCVYTSSWLEECVEYYKSEASGTVIFEELCSQVLGQWCLLDLNEVSIPSLPQQLASRAKFELTGSYALQVNVAMDVSSSAYTQHQQLRRADTDNLDVDEERRTAGPAEPRGKRMLRLSLTDGVQAIFAVEHKPIKLFNQTLVPGCKVLISGPVLSRRGILFLCERNISLLGGEVDSLLVPNALENVLARRLGLPENPDPYRLQPVDAVFNVAPPEAVHNDWGDELWEQDLVEQLPDILSAADANHNLGGSASTDRASTSLGSRGDPMASQRSDSVVANGASAFSNLANGNHRSNQPGNQSNNVPSGTLNAWRSHRNGSYKNDWNTEGCPRTEANDDVSSPPRSSYVEDNDESPYPQKIATFTLSDSEDEFLQNIDVEAAIRMTQAVRPISDRPHVASANSDRNQMHEASSSFAVQGRQAVAMNWPTEEEMEDEEFQPAVVRPRQNWRKEEEEDDDMGFEPQTCFPRRYENPSSRYEPTKPRSRQEAFEELRAKRKKAQGGVSAIDLKPLASKDVSRVETDSGFAGSTVNKPTSSRYIEGVEQDTKAARPELLAAGTLAQKRVDVRLEPLKSEPLESEPMDTKPEPVAPSQDPTVLEAEPFVYLGAVDKGRHGRRYVVKATILQLLSGLRAQDGRWHLDAEIADGSGATLVVRFANAVLDTLTGYSVPEVAALKKQMVTNPLIKERLHEDLQQARQRLADLNCLMTLEVKEDSSVEVIALTQMTESHRQSLVDRTSRLAHH